MAALAGYVMTLSIDRAASLPILYLKPLYRAAQQDYYRLLTVTHEQDCRLDSVYAQGWNYLQSERARLPHTPNC